VFQNFSKNNHIKITIFKENHPIIEVIDFKLDPLCLATTFHKISQVYGSNPIIRMSLLDEKGNLLR